MVLCEKQISRVICRIMALENVHVLTFITYVCVMLYDSVELRLQIELSCQSSDLDMRRLSWIIHLYSKYSQGLLKMNKLGRRVSA